MTEMIIWPPTVPERLQDLPEGVATILGTTSRPVESIEDVATAASPALLLLDSRQVDHSAVFGDLDRALTARSSPTVIVIGDGWIGTDGPDVAAAVLGAGAVALVRSVAVRRAGPGRVNIVCIPESFVAKEGSQRGPLAVGIADIAAVVAFVLGSESGYVQGQVLYANGGRQLFSSMTA